MRIDISYLKRWNLEFLSFMGIEMFMAIVILENLSNEQLKFY